MQRAVAADQPEPGAVSLLGTTYGGDGQTNFALPNLHGRTPIHVGSGHTLGESGGEQAHTLSIAELPQHIHVAQATTPTADTPAATANVLAGSPASSTPRPPS